MDTPPASPDAPSGSPWTPADAPDLGEAMRQLVQFQKNVAELKKCPDIVSALDLMERLLEHIVEFVFARLYLRGEDGQLEKVREFCPESVTVDNALIQWGAQNTDVAIVPIEIAEGEFTLRSLVLLPFAGSTDNRGLLLLWLPQDTSAFTLDQEARLGILARETAAVLESLRFHARLEKARGTLADIVESVPLGLMAVDGDDFIILINGTMEIALGVHRASVTGVPYMAALPAPVSKLIRKLIGEGLRDEHEITLAIGGAERHLGFTATPVRYDRNRAGGAHVVLCRDLELSREVAKLRELDAMKNDFLALVSHELRTPLTSIIAYTETLLLDPDIDPETSREYLGTIAQEGQHLCKLINNVLDLTQMEAGRFDYRPGALDVNEFVGTMLMHTESAFQAKNQELRTDLGERLPEITGDGERLAQAFGNILDNANKYCPEGAKVVIRTRAAPPDARMPVPSVQVDIEDDGPGISKENQRRLFNKFGVTGNIAHHTRGTGLGMAIAKHIIEEGHVGLVWLDSEPGHGTHIHIRLPVRPPGEADR